MTLTYGVDGQVQTITDARNQQVVYQRDPAGRVTHSSLPGNRVIGFGYDANGNVTSITPPGKPGHGFQYSPVDLEGEYDPPLNGLPLVKTQYRYNRDKQLTTVIRPDGTALTVGYDSAGRASTPWHRPAVRVAR